MSPKTNTFIVLTMGAALLSIAASSDTHSRADIDDIENGTAQRSLNYATYEPDKWLMNGSFHFAPDPANIGFVSQDISDAGGNFTSDPVLTLTLENVVDIEQGLTLEFSDISGDYCDSFKVEYKDISSVLIDDETYSPTEYNFFAEAPTNPVEDVKYIVITFYSTNTAYRHLRLLGVYVDGVLFDSQNIRKANIVEEIDQISVSSPSNSLDFTLFSSDGDFSIVNPQGVYAELERGQTIDVYESLNTSRLYMGRFYLKDWKSKSDNLAEFVCEDALALLGTEKMYGKWFKEVTEWTAQEAMDCIMGDVFCSTAPPSRFDYEIDASLASEIVVGWLPITNRREALQQLAFSVGGFVTCSRSDKVEIRPLELVDSVSSWDFLLDAGDIANPDTILKPLVTGIKITAHSFEDQEPALGQPVVFDGNAKAGPLTIFPQGEIDILGTVNVDVSNPLNTAVTSSATSSEDNYAEFTVTGAGRLILIDYKKNSHNREEYIIEVPDLPANTPDNIIVIENATLVNPDNVAEIALRMLAYYQQRYEMKVKLFASEIAIGDTAKIDTQASKQLSGVVDRMEIDLTGGLTQLAKSTGAILPYSPTWYGIEYLLIGGGGAGGSRLAGGGGAGEFVNGIDLLVIDEVYNIVIGTGGTGGIDQTGGDGTDTTFNAHTAHGGGGGGRGSHIFAVDADDGADGGNGGGGGGNSAAGVDGAGGAGYRKKGGDGSNGASNYGGGGGGGNDERGSGGASGEATTGQGGDGKESSITGSAVVYGGGGGGCGVVDVGAGGDGGGGDASKTTAPDAGTDYLGGGGGASGVGTTAGASGGIGKAILRILTAKYSGTTTGSPDVSVDGDYTVLEYESDGSYTA